MRTQVVIIGAGPSGVLLSLLLSNSGIETIVLERQSPAHVLARIRAGVLEWGTVQKFREAGLSARMDEEGLLHEGVFLASRDNFFRINVFKATGKQLMVYGQTEVTKDLYNCMAKAGRQILHNVKDVRINHLKEINPNVDFIDQDGRSRKIFCDFVVGCDGFHGVSRKSIPNNEIKVFERNFPFGWLGVLSRTRPLKDELIYANSSRGFALASMRNQNLSRYYLQVPLQTKVQEWSDQKFWDELKLRLPEQITENLAIGPSIEKSITPLRSFVVEPMQFGNLFLVGDAAHIVPPTGAKGLNLAISDVHYLSSGLINFYQTASREALEYYTETALKRVWKALRFSWWMTNLLHQFPTSNSFEQKIKESELEYLSGSIMAQASFAENYVGLPY